MPQSSIYYAVGRLSVLQKSTLDKNRLDRLLAEPDVREARRSLQELGWGDSADYELMAQNHVEEGCRLVKKLALDENIVNCFLLRYDANNLKMLFKARCLDQEATELSPCGVWSLDALRHAVTEHRYSLFPKVLSDALNELEKRLSVAPDPLDVDVTLDKAMYECIFSWLPKKALTEKKYFTAKVDLTNYVMALRALHMEKPASFFKSLILPGGSVAVAAWMRAYEKPEKLPLLLNRYGTKMYQCAIAAQMDHAKAAALERMSDDYLLSLYAAYRRELEMPERIIAFLLSREREAAAVRLIMAGKTAGFPMEKIKERLRDLYG